MLFISFWIACCMAAPAGAVDGVYQGCWTDYEGNNYCGDAPSGGSSSGSSYDSGYYSDGYSALGEALGAIIAQGIADAAVAAQGYEYNSQGNRYAAQGKYEEAIAAYEQALQFIPNDYTVLQNIQRARAGQHLARGRDYHKLGNIERALAEYRQAIAYDPANRTAHQYVRLAEQRQAYASLHQREEEQRAQMASAAVDIGAQGLALARSLRSTKNTAPLDLAALPPSAYGPQRGLRIKKDIPLPGSGPDLPPPSLAERSEALKPYVEAADRLLDDASLALWEGKIWLRTEATALGVNTALDKAATVVPWVGRVQQIVGLKEETEALYGEVGKPQEETAAGAFDHLSRAVDQAANPNQTSTGDEIDEWLESESAKYRKLADETYMSKYRSKAEGLFKSFQEQNKAFVEQAGQEK
jgi:tetratricopeptide (TPR) repeat protein